ncbi:MFS transporter [Pandoraea sp.]|uniref:MFS transporter n=1 Tax=Pandoraea sp. TaxID=1883445 RepID=UPI00121A6E7D|nr:MFS transporter [Pandoraea sp.]TAL55921.1 MAG: MFS transporter [Pandoraea sp.]TAM20536.1 MAG: MFS transporter [Pandoraea sp.]
MDPHCPNASTLSTSSFSPASCETFSLGATLIFAMLVGTAVLPLYASQALINGLDASLHLGAWTSLVTGLTLLGYAAGLFALVPLVDRLPLRPLIGATLGTQAVALVFAAWTPSAPDFLGASFVIGVSASAIQMLIPAAATLAGPAARGKVIGNVMSGLMLGILLSRPLAGLADGTLGWRSFFVGDAAVLILTLVLALPRVPALRPAARPSYRSLVASLGKLVADEPVLRHHALCQGLLMAGFNAFWTSVAIVLARAPLNLGPLQIALFTLAGAASVAVAPLAGRAGDRGHAGPAARIAHRIAIGGTLLAALAVSPHLPTPVSVLLLAVAACLIDASVIADQTLGRRAINLLAPEVRGRLNGLYTGLFFLGSAIGAAFAGPVFARAGWIGVCALSAVFFVGAALVHRIFLFSPHPA